MRILHVTRYFIMPSETFILNTVKMLKEDAACRNYLLTMFKDETLGNFFENELVVVKFKPRYWSGGRNILSPVFWNVIFKEPFLIPVAFFTKLRLFLNRCFKKKPILNFISKTNPDFIYFHFGWAFFELYKILRGDFPDYPIVVSFHGSDVTSYALKEPKYAVAIKSLADRSRVIFTVTSQFLKGELIRLGVSSEKIVILSNTVDSRFLSGPRLNPEMVRKDFLRIINVSRMVTCKGHEYLIQAFSEFLKERDGELTLVGDGDRAEYLKTLIKTLGIEKKVNLLGTVPHDEINKLLANHDVYVQPSIHDEKSGQCESFGIVLLEAISAGLPVIVAKTGGMPEVVKSEKFEKQFYFMIDQKDSEGILQTLLHMSSDNYRFLDNVEYLKNRLEEFSNEKYMDRLFKHLGKITRN